MASQITHIVYGKDLFQKLKPALNWKEFVIGTTFPDIRQITGIERERWHQHGTSLNEVPQDNSFESGVYIHSYVDEKREEYLRSKGVYELVGHDPVYKSVLKLVEDEIVYKRLQDWDEISSFFDSILKHEAKLVGKKYVEKWHNFLKEYVVRKPNEKIWRSLLQRMDMYSHLTEEIMSAIEKIKKNKKVISIIEEAGDIFK